ncbi:uncharacterized protein PHALS_15492 [Plasmopara halstedii]|uniref:Uncharacterized protein n=1 Tax=Plasmopara halstedii TaxID=4781 RepID=A0A0N7L5D4_PLAHL|nr:uncharacterized protein PHALS_15492 [Plasmopara halstedii]CEG41163.1 hypothetical protein PHALS_15492 [Plasmopara halstedii]|eukprot:XP_024577532.1 hypothetical protein PHALS_15492 [Plasmopara halstedii]
MEVYIETNILYLLSIRSFVKKYDKRSAIWKSQRPNSKTRADQQENDMSMPDQLRQDRAENHFLPP